MRDNKESEARKLAEKKAAHDYEQVTKQGQDNYPKLDFSTFVLSLSSSALVHLGEVPDPESGKNNLNLALAKQTIDVLGMLEQKTKGNLTGQEERLLKDILFDLRMKYVQKTM
ncbi:MAG: DUF1844 domain-containing protein [Desulfonauticus sp.]|nr:DUF1844 domain-containing protein [Desulfonauticus sp.]